MTDFPDDPMEEDYQAEAHQEVEAEAHREVEEEQDLLELTSLPYQEPEHQGEATS